MWLFFITGLLGYISKLPFIGKVLSLLALYYRKSTFLQILIKIRKGFVIFNALIGVYLVFKSVGFSTDNLLIGFIAMGETYLQTLIGLTSKLFHWFVELFDHKIVPNVPGDNGGTWFSRPMSIESKPVDIVSRPKSLIVPSNVQSSNLHDLINAPGFSLRSLYKDAVISPSRPWYSLEYNTLWWLGVTIGTIGFIYLGYNLVYNPMFDIFGVNPRTNIQPPTPPSDNEQITLGAAAANAVTDFSKRIVNVYNTTINALNPFNYFVTSNELQAQYNLYMEIQNDYSRANRRLFPFTEYNPLDPWYKRLRLQFFGESGKEFIERNQLINKADAVYESLKVGKGKAVDTAQSLWSNPSSTWNSPKFTPRGALSPLPNIIGLNNDAIDAFNRANAGLVEKKLSSIPGTPKMGSMTEWANHVIDKSSGTLEELEARLRIVKNPLPSSSTNPTIVEVTSSINVDTLDSPPSLPNTPVKRDFLL